MYKYDGRLIHESHDEEGILEVVDQGGVRSLHFGSEPVQSSMLLTDPDKLHLSYIRAMTSWLLFKDTLNNADALIIGLGAGSLTKHLLYHFPNCRLKAVEYRQGVVKIARSHFELPRDPRLKIIIDDGGRYVLQHADTDAARYSVIFVDAFDHEGMAQSVSTEAFFQSCKKLLTADGLLVINLWGGVGNPFFHQVSLSIAQVFNWKILFLPVKNRGNIIGLAFNDNTPDYALKTLRIKALTLEQHYDIEFLNFLKELKKHNVSTLNSIIKS